MPRLRQSLRSNGATARRLRTLLGASSLLALLAVGCAGDRPGAANDPLLGGPSARPNPTGTLASTTPTNPVAPAAPVPSSPTSNAALAGSKPRVLDSANDLRIGEPGRSQYVHEPAGGAVLSRPVPVNSSPPSSTPTFGPSSSASPSSGHSSSAGASAFLPSSARGSSHAPGAHIGSYEQAQAFLASHGVTWQRLETWGDKGEWKFTCSVPNKQNQFISRNYEAKAHDYLAAIQAVIEQMEKD